MFCGFVICVGMRERVNEAGRAAGAAREPQRRVARRVQGERNRTNTAQPTNGTGGDRADASGATCRCAATRPKATGGAMEASDRAEERKMSDANADEGPAVRDARRRAARAMRGTRRRRRSVRGGAGDGAGGKQMSGSERSDAAHGGASGSIRRGRGGGAIARVAGRRSPVAGRVQ